MVTEFYAALAGAASVFIGILTAMLVSNISNTRTEQAQILHRIKTIDSRLESLDQQREELEEEIEDILWVMEKEDLEEDAEVRVSEFIDEYVGYDYSPDPNSVDLESATKAFADYEGMSKKEVQADEFLTDELEARLDDIRRRLSGRSAKADLQPSSEQVAAQQQMDTQRRIHQREQHNNYQNRWHQTKSDIQALQNERAKLTPRFEAIGTTEEDLLRAIGVASIFSVVLPLFAYWIRVSGFVIIRNVPVWFEPTGIILIWVIGLVYVFNHLREQLDEDGGELPDEPEVELDEDVSGTN